MKKQRLDRFKSGKQLLAHTRRSENYAGEKVEGSHHTVFSKKGGFVVIPVHANKDLATRNAARHCQANNCHRSQFDCDGNGCLALVRRNVLMDYVLAFELSNAATRPSDMTSQLIAIAERTHSDIGGGCDNERGEFYINASSRFKQSDLLDMVSMLLPYTTNLTISAMISHKSKRRQAISSIQSKNSKRTARRVPSPRRAPKIPVKV